MSKVYIFFADGFEEIEGLTVVDLLRRTKIDISTVSITGNKLVTGAHNITITADLLFEDTDFKDADLLALPGGIPGTNHLMEHMGLNELLKNFNEKGKPLAAICAAPKVLGANGILKGKNAICYPGHEDGLIDAKLVDAPVVVDGTIITSKGMGTSIDFSLAIIKYLAGEEQARMMADKIEYQHYV